MWKCKECGCTSFEAVINTTRKVYFDRSGALNYDEGSSMVDEEVEEITCADCGNDDRKSFFGYGSGPQIEEIAEWVE